MFLLSRETENCVNKARRRYIFEQDLLLVSPEDQVGGCCKVYVGVFSQSNMHLTNVAAISAHN